MMSLYSKNKLVRHIYDAAWMVAVPSLCFAAVGPKSWAAGGILATFLLVSIGLVLDWLGDIA